VESLLANRDAHLFSLGRDALWAVLLVRLLCTLPVELLCMPQGLLLMPLCALLQQLLPWLLQRPVLAMLTPLRPPFPFGGEQGKSF